MSMNELMLCIDRLLQIIIINYKLRHCGVARVAACAEVGAEAIDGD